MTEVIYILVMTYAIYVVYIVITSNKKQDAEALESETHSSAAGLTDKIAEQVVVEQVKPNDKIIASAASSAKLPDGRLRNPETGEVDKIANNYQMTKRWIKEALVAEGLAEKIYKTNEMDDATKEKINNALNKLQTMDKYQ